VAATLAAGGSRFMQTTSASSSRNVHAASNQRSLCVFIDMIAIHFLCWCLRTLSCKPLSPDRNTTRLEWDLRRKHRLRRGCYVTRNRVA
jgi:hypothetical protein